MTGTELMPRLVVGYTETGCSKLKKGNGFLKPNFGVGPNSLLSDSYHKLVIRQAQARFLGSKKVNLSIPYRNLRQGAFAERSRAVA